MEWDEAKRLSNLQKHCVDFATLEACDWDEALVYEDIRKPYGEQRMIDFVPLAERLHVVVFVERNGQRRVLSARKPIGERWQVMKKKLIYPSDEEERWIAEGIVSDPGTVPDITTLPPGSLRLVGRPKSAKPKSALNIRLDADIVEHYRQTGPGWQTRINVALRKAAGLRSMTKD